jgi:hypothetical protein
MPTGPTTGERSYFLMSEKPQDPKSMLGITALKQGMSWLVPQMSNEYNDQFKRSLACTATLRARMNANQRYINNVPL